MEEKRKEGKRKCDISIDQHKELERSFISLIEKGNTRGAIEKLSQLQSNLDNIGQTCRIDNILSEFKDDLNFLKTELEKGFPKVDLKKGARIIGFGEPTKEESTQLLAIAKLKFMKDEGTSNIIEKIVKEEWIG